MVLASSAGSPGSIPDRGTGSCIRQLGVLMLQLKIPHAATETLSSQIFIFKKMNKVGFLGREGTGTLLSGE